MKWTPEKRSQLSKLYDINWTRMAREAARCNCWKEKTKKCSNPKHMFYVKRERELQKLSVQATESLSGYYKNKSLTADELLDRVRKESSK